MRFINDDVIIKRASKKGANISKKELEDILLNKFFPKYLEKTYIDKKLASEDKEKVIETLIRLMLNDTSKGIIRDMKYISPMVFGLGYVKIHSPFQQTDPNSLLGFHKLNKNLTFLGFVSGVDETSLKDCWITLNNGKTMFNSPIKSPTITLPVFSILYYDGKRIRLYTPTYGNPVNTDFKCNIGDETHELIQELNKTDISKIKDRYKKLGIFDSKKSYAQMYCSKYTLDFNEKEDCINWSAIHEDLITSFDK